MKQGFDWSVVPSKSILDRTRNATKLLCGSGVFESGMICMEKELYCFEEPAPRRLIKFIYIKNNIHRTRPIQEFLRGSEIETCSPYSFSGYEVNRACLRLLIQTDSSYKRSGAYLSCCWEMEYFSWHNL